MFREKIACHVLPYCDRLLAARRETPAFPREHPRPRSVLCVPICIASAGVEVMQGNQQSYLSLRSLCRNVLLAFFLTSLATLLAVGTLAQEAVPPTARQAAAMPKYASRLAHGRTIPLNPSRLPVARLNRRRGSPQDQIIYDNGPTTYTADAWAINFSFAVSDSLSLSSSSPATAAAFILWLSPGDNCRPSVDLSVGTSPFA